MKARLFDRIASPRALLAAFYRARRGKGSRPEVDSFFAGLEKEVFRLSRELEAETYRPGAYRHFLIREPKLRLVSAAPFRDRVLHHAIHAELEPIVERRLIFDTYACRRNKGQHRALDRFTSFARRYPWCMKLDIRRYFPSIDHGRLLGLLGNLIEDERLMRLLERIVASGAGIHPSAAEPEWFAGDDLLAPLSHPRGLPIGNLTSQLFANLYLSPLDDHVKRRLGCRAYLRYMDDMMFFARKRSELVATRDSVSAFLDTWRLRIHPEKCLVHRVEQGTPYLGFHVFPDHRLLLGGNVRRFGRRLEALGVKYAAGAISLAQVRQSLASWIGHASHGDTFHLRRNMIEKTRWVRAVADDA